MKIELRNIIVLTCVLVSAILIFFIFKTKQNVRVTNIESINKLETFKNDLYEINYPKDFNLTWSLTDSSIVYLEHPYQNININIYSKNDFGISEPIGNWAKKHGEELLDKTILVDSNRAIITRKLTKYDLHSFYIVKQSDGSIITFDVSILNYNDSKLELAEKIISSLVFIK